MTQQGVQEQAVRHNDQDASHRDLIVCLWLSAAVVSVQKDVIVKDWSSNAVRH